MSAKPSRLWSPSKPALNMPDLSIISRRSPGPEIAASIVISSRIIDPARLNELGEWHLRTLGGDSGPEAHSVKALRLAGSSWIAKC